MQEWQRQKGSKGKGFGLLVCRRSASAVTSRGLHPRQFAARGRAGQVAPVAARFARAHREASARPRGLHPGQFAARGRAGQVAPVAARFARAHREASARPRGLHPGQFAARGRAGQVAPVAARFARAHREINARARRGWCAALPLPLGCVTKKAPFAGASPKKKKGLLRWQRAFRFTGERRGGTPSASSPPTRPREARAGAGISPCGSRRPRSSAGPGDCWRGGPR